MFQNQLSSLQSWLRLCDQLDALTRQISTDQQNLKDAEIFRDRLYAQLPWFYLCRATAGQIQRYNESKAAVADAEKTLAAIKERECQLISHKNALYDDMLDKDPSYRAAKDKAETWKLLSSKGEYALSVVQDAIDQIKNTISEKEHDLIQDIREQQTGEQHSGFRNWSVSWEFDRAKSKIRNAKQAVTELCEQLISEFPEEARSLQAAASLIDESIGHASCGDSQAIDDSPLYGSHLIQKMSTVQGQLQMLISLLTSTASNCGNRCSQFLSQLHQAKHSFEEKLMSNRSEHTERNISIFR